MNEMKELEIQLRSWAPRRPSARVSRRLFSSPAASANAAAHNQSATTGYQSPPFRLSWLAPATAALLLLFAMFNQKGPASSTSGSSRAMVAMILSNQSYAPFLPGSYQPEQNAVPRDSFEWTNAGGSTSSMRSLSPMKAND